MQYFLFCLLCDNKKREGKKNMTCDVLLSFHVRTKFLSLFFFWIIFFHATEFTVIFQGWHVSVEWQRTKLEEVLLKWQFFSSFSSGGNLIIVHQIKNLSLIIFYLYGICFSGLLLHIILDTSNVDQKNGIGRIEPYSRVTAS